MCIVILHGIFLWAVCHGLREALEKLDDVKELNIPSIMAQAWRDLGNVYGGAVVNQIDSGF